MKRSRTCTAACVAGLVIGALGCNERAVGPSALVSDVVLTGPVELLVTNLTDQDVEVSVQFESELVSLELVEADSAMSFELTDGALLQGGYARFIVESVGVERTHWSDDVWVIAGSTVDLTIARAGVLIVLMPGAPDDDCGDLGDSCPVD